MNNPTFKSYKRLNGHDEFKEFINTLPTTDRTKMQAVIASTCKFGLQVAIKMKWVKKLDKNLYELRSKVSSNIQRACYFHSEENQYIITHGFTKKPINPRLKK